MIITGLRGVGKTVLLNELRRRADDAGWAVVEIEVSKHRGGDPSPACLTSRRCVRCLAS
jgi:molybdopterin-guanine dinucleotide biosynthesis protein